ncbi:MAG TPA: SDR family oxidoreductase [Anaerolineales bacterium]|nr:SDR family oxidoreductase [Anaerolineales bacterium]
MNERVFVITGATGTTGKAAARAFAKRGASLVLIGTDPSRLDALARDLKLPTARYLTLTADLRCADAVHSAAEAVAVKFGRLDGLIHLVGGWVGGKTIAETPVNDFESMLGQHAWTTFHLLKEFAPRLAANQWGRVIVVSAPSAVNPQGKTSAYAAAKAAQENLVLTMAAELKESNVTANIIQVKSIDVNGDGKGTAPDEIVASMIYLCSDEAGKITSARIPLFR